MTAKPTEVLVWWEKVADMPAARKMMRSWVYEVAEGADYLPAKQGLIRDFTRVVLEARWPLSTPTVTSLLLRRRKTRDDQPGGRRGACPATVAGTGAREPVPTEEPRTARHPARVVAGDAAARDDHVHVRMIEDPLGVRQEAGDKLYLANLRDPDRNKLRAPYRKPSLVSQIKTEEGRPFGRSSSHPREHQRFCSR
jgi:hypothetical protein